MRIPHAPGERIDWLYATLARLRASLDTRRIKYQSWRTWYLHGAAEWGARYNMIGPQVNTLAGYLYAPRSVRFSMGMGPVARAAHVAILETAAERLRTVWNDSGADEVYAAQVQWALVYGTALVKFVWRNGTAHCDAVGAGDVGVWRDDLCGLDGQQAILHTYRLDAETVGAWLAKSGLSEKEVEAWLARWQDGGNADAPASGSIAIGQMNPINWNGPPSSGSAGAVADWGSVSADYVGRDTPTIEIEEVWAKDDAAGDWRIFQIVQKDLILSDRPNDYLPGHHPFVQVTCDRIDDWFWGRSTVEQLIPLQSLREKRMNQIDRLAARQANPPMVLSGFSGVNDEKAAAVMRRGGLLAASQVPGAKVELLTPQVSEVSFQIINDIDAMFSNTLGLTEMLQGQSSGKERGGAHARVMMEAGAGRLTGRMLNVERSVAESASLLLALTKRYDATVLVDDDGAKYVMGQVPSDTTVDVTAHSSSPLFASRAQQEAVQLMELGIIDKEDFIDLADPPMAQALKQRMKAREKAQAKQVEDAVKATPANDRWRLFAGLFGGKARRS